MCYDLFRSDYINGLTEVVKVFTGKGDKAFLSGFMFPEIVNGFQFNWIRHISWVSGMVGNRIKGQTAVHPLSKFVGNTTDGIGRQKFQSGIIDLNLVVKKNFLINTAIGHKNATDIAGIVFNIGQYFCLYLPLANGDTDHKVQQENNCSNNIDFSLQFHCINYST